VVVTSAHRSPRSLMATPNVRKPLNGYCSGAQESTVPDASGFPVPFLAGRAATSFAIEGVTAASFHAMDLRQSRHILALLEARSCRIRRGVGASAASQQTGAATKSSGPS
jgi:hypothetical protein